MFTDSNSNLDQLEPVRLPEMFNRTLRDETHAHTEQYLISLVQRTWLAIELGELNPTVMTDSVRRATISLVRRDRPKNSSNGNFS